MTRSDLFGVFDHLPWRNPWPHLSGAARPRRGLSLVRLLQQQQGMPGYHGGALLENLPKAAAITHTAERTHGELLAAIGQPPDDRL